MSDSNSSLEKILDFVGEHPILTVILVIAVLGFLTDIISH
jgi:hypothetical protein